MELSGPVWTERFPTSTRVEDLEPQFRSRVRRFLDALSDAGAEITITATLRPRERAYLMHYAWAIVHHRIAPGQVPSFEPIVPTAPAVSIAWVHRDKRGRPSQALSYAAALEMVHGYDIAKLRIAPSLSSLHIEGKAVDMVIAWDGELVMKDASGKELKIRTSPRSGINGQLMKVGASYGVVHLHPAHKDPPHWSVNGH